MMGRFLLPALLVLAAPARAADRYAALQPLVGTWLVAKDCGGVKSKLTVAFKRLPNGMVAEFTAPGEPELNSARANIVATDAEDRYRVVAALPKNPVLQTLNVTSIAGTMVVSTDDEDEEEELPNNVLTCTARVSVLTSVVTIRLRDGYKKATFLFSTESPLGRETCRGAGTRQRAAKKAGR